MNRAGHLLVILSEECAEVTKEVSKALRFGLNDCNPNAIISESNINNSQRITKEVADLMGILEMLYEENIIECPKLYDILEKKERVEKYLKHSESKGMLESDIESKNKLLLSDVSTRSSCCNSSLDTDEQSYIICSNCGERL